MTWAPNRDEKKLCEAFLSLKTGKEAAQFLRDLLTIGEIQEFAKRLKIAQLLYRKKLTYKQIAQKVQTSTSTVTRVAHWLHHGEGGYQIILQRLFKK